MRALFAVVAAAAALPAASRSGPAQERAAREEAVRLRLTPDSGRTLTYAHRTRARMEAPPQLGGGQSLEFRMRLRRTAVRLGDDSLDYRMELTDVRLSADSVPLGQLPDVTRHEGRTFRARMTTRGELVRLRVEAGSAAPARPGGIAPVRRSVRMSGFPPLPDAPVRPGDAWTDTTLVETGLARGMQEGTTVAVSRTTLEEVEREGESRIATLSVVSSYSFRPADSARSAVRADVSGSGSSTARFDVTHGRYLRADSSQDFTVNFRFPDTSRVHSVRLTVDSEAQLVGVGGGRDGTSAPGDPTGAAAPGPRPDE